MSAPISKTEATQAQSNQDNNAAAKQSTDKNLQASKEATAKGFATTSADDKESTKPDPDYTQGKIRGD
jgi:hypothetical protein